ncbi:MAG: peptide ABC transporter ATP-binding protein [Deltaproteobacteria bacterium]|nr:peptide ABC transporter ATP-binding protein [Deltaproteobacteria bacterium]
MRKENPAKAAVRQIYEGHDSERKELLTVRGLVSAFDTERGLLRAVDGVSFSVDRGKTLGIVGESGCGKSVTAMSLISLLPRPAGRVLSGEVLFKGEDLQQVPEKRLHEIRGGEIGTIFQEPMTALNPVHRIGRQVSEVFRLHEQMGKKEAWEAAIEALRMTRIPSPEIRVGDYPHQLSGGMRQRVVIAMALACQPDLLIADEPTTALDVTVQAQILDLIQGLQAEMGMAAILITHDLGVIAENCDEVVVMYAGRVVERAPVEELFTNPLHAYTRGLLNSIPRLSLPPKTKLNTIPGMVAALSEMASGCRFCQRLERESSLGDEQPEFREASPGHWVEACPECYGGEAHEAA